MQKEIITSAQNPRIKHLLLLQQKSSERRKCGLFVVEGQRELLHCVNAGYEIATLYCCPDIVGESELDGFFASFPNSCRDIPCINISKTLYEKVACRGTTEGVIAEIRARRNTLENLSLPKNPLVIVLESVEKPGNLGAVLRSADAAKADAVIVCDPLTDLFNPNLIRSSIGAVFTVPTVACTSEECISFLKQHNIQILTAQLQDSRLYYDTPMTGGTAIVMGTESTGLTSQWREAADAHIRHSYAWQVDSLNVSVSAAILMFEAVRQRAL